MKTTKTIMHVILIVIAVLILVGTFTDSLWLNYPLKPLIMAWMAVYFLVMTRPQAYRWLVIIAFFFSWAGDVLLMVADKNEILFFAGVGGFFLSQLTYILVFSRFARKPGKGFLNRKPIWLVPFLVYLSAIYLILSPKLEGVMKPVILLYAISLMAMSLSALNRYTQTENVGFWMLFSGSLFFMGSDTLLAINKFTVSLPYSGFLVLSTYMLAQYLIVRGLVRSSQADES